MTLRHRAGMHSSNRFIKQIMRIKKNFIAVLVITTLLFCCSSCSIFKKHGDVLSDKIPPQKLQSDLIVLKKVLEANHPSLYWYIPKDSLDYFFNSTLNSITDSLTERQFRNKVAYIISNIHCGHTSVRSSKAYTSAVIKNPGLQFPLAIKTWSDTMVVVGNAFRDDSVLKRGTIITSINGISNKQLLDSMFSFISMDGYADDFKSQLISFNFPAFYKNSFGLSPQYNITYLDTVGNQQNTIIKNYDIKADTAKSKNTAVNLPPFRKPTRKELRTLRRLAERGLQTDTATGTAIMRITTFSGSRMRSFFKKSFRQLQQQQIKHLIIDLRENGGGNVQLSTALAEYIVDNPFRNADTIAAISRSFKYGRYIHNWLPYWFMMHIMSRKKNDDRYHLGYYERHLFKPKKEDHFNGQVYILQSGFTFSASCMFIETVRSQPNVTLIGEETGGGSYGNSAIHLPNIVLPNSRIRVSLPMYRVVFDHTKTKTGRGIFPDVAVHSSPATIKAGIDIKMQTALGLIKTADSTVAAKH